MESTKDRLRADHANNYGSFSRGSLLLLPPARATRRKQEFVRKGQHFIAWLSARSIGSADRLQAEQTCDSFPVRDSAVLSSRSPTSPYDDLRERGSLVQRADGREPGSFGDCDRSLSGRTTGGAYHGGRTKPPSGREVARRRRDGRRMRQVFSPCGAKTQFFEKFSQNLLTVI